MKYFILILFTFSIIGVKGQETLSLNGKTSPESTLEEVAWLAGYWKGEAFGGVVEELWSPPSGDSMMGSFRLITEGKISFYELCQIRQEGKSLMMRIKHFHGDLKGWEEKDETVEFPLVKLETNAVYFDGWTIKKLSEDKMVMYVRISSENGKIEEAEFNYTKKSLH